MLRYLIVLGRDLKKDGLSRTRENTPMTFLRYIGGVCGEQQSELSPIGSERGGAIVR